MMHQSIHDSGCDDGVSEVIAEILEGNVRGQKGRCLAVPAVDDLEEEGGISGVLLLDPVKPHFVDQEDVRGGEVFQFLGKALVGEAGHQLRQHLGRGGVAAAIHLLTSDQEQGLGDMAFPGAGVTGNDQPLLARNKVELGDLEHLGLIHPGLEGKVEVREKLSLRETGLFDSSLDPSFDPGHGFDRKEPFQKVRGQQRLLCGTGELLVKDFLYPQKLQGLQMLPDLC